MNQQQFQKDQGNSLSVPSPIYVNYPFGKSDLESPYVNVSPSNKQSNDNSKNTLPTLYQPSGPTFPGKLEQNMVGLQSKNDRTTLKQKQTELKEVLSENNSREGGIIVYDLAKIQKQGSRRSKRRRPRRRPIKQTHSLERLSVEEKNQGWTGLKDRRHSFSTVSQHTKSGFNPSNLRQKRKISESEMNIDKKLHYSSTSLDQDEKNDSTDRLDFNSAKSRPRSGKVLRDKNRKKEEKKSASDPLNNKFEISKDSGIGSSSGESLTSSRGSDGDWSSNSYEGDKSNEEVAGSLVSSSSEGKVFQLSRLSAAGKYLETKFKPKTKNKNSNIKKNTEVKPQKQSKARLFKPISKQVKSFRKYPGLQGTKPISPVTSKKKSNQFCTQKKKIRNSGSSPTQSSESDFGGSSQSSMDTSYCDYRQAEVALLKQFGSDQFQHFDPSMTKEIVQKKLTEAKEKKRSTETATVKEGSMLHLTVSKMKNLQLWEKNPKGYAKRQIRILQHYVYLSLVRIKDVQSILESSNYCPGLQDEFHWLQQMATYLRRVCNNIILMTEHEAYFMEDRDSKILIALLEKIKQISVFTIKNYKRVQAYSRQHSDSTPMHTKIVRAVEKTITTQSTNQQKIKRKSWRLSKRGSVKPNKKEQDQKMQQFRKNAEKQINLSQIELAEVQQKMYNLRTGASNLCNIKEYKKLIEDSTQVSLNISFKIQQLRQFSASIARTLSQTLKDELVKSVGNFLEEFIQLQQQLKKLISDIELNKLVMLNSKKMAQASASQRSSQSFTDSSTDSQSESAQSSFKRKVRLPRKDVSPIYVNIQNVLGGRYSKPPSTLNPLREII